jgi:hypothetical protein
MSTSTISVPYVEPWLRGTYADVPAVGRAVLHALDLALEDISKWTEGLTDSEAHAEPLGLTSVSFHLKHIARSVDRLLGYAEGNQLTGEQLAALKAEAGGEETLAELLAEVEVSFSNAAERVSVLATADIDWRCVDPRCRPRAEACGAGGDDGEGDQGATGHRLGLLHKCSNAGILASHPWHKGKSVPRMGHPTFIKSLRVLS